MMRVLIILKKAKITQNLNYEVFMDQKSLAFLT